jgi:hypothetical protein
VKAKGKTYNIGSEHKWAEWQVPPVICPICLKRVTLKDAFFASHTLGTFHRDCAPYSVKVVVT